MSLSLSTFATKSCKNVLISLSLSVWQNVTTQIFLDNDLLGYNAM
jgi:hypothetical protein